MKNIFFILLCICLAGCSEEKVKPQVNNFLNEQKLPAQESRNFKMLFSELGILKAVLYAKDAKVYENKQETILESVKIDFYNDKEIKTSTLTSKRGRVDDLTKNMFAIDSVVAVSDSGVTLRTDELMWRNKDKKIVSDKFVTILTPKEKIQGYGFESDQGLRNYVIYKPTVVTNFEANKDTLK
jgi:LPS export ABC transporter protein LptC